MKELKIFFQNISLFPLILLLLVPVIFGSCSKETPCYDNYLSLAFVGFSDTELDTIKIVKLDKANDNTLDTFLINRTSAYYQKTNDTTFISSFKVDILNKINNWTIYLLTPNKTFRISDIANETKTKKCGGLFSLDCFPCNNKVVSYKINSVIKLVDSIPEVIYIQK